MSADDNDRARDGKLDDDPFKDAQPFDGHAQEGVQPVIRSLSEVEEREVEWLWPGFLPRGELCALQGDPGVGKSLIAQTVAAELTKGGKLPAHEGRGMFIEAEQCNVLWLSKEDAPEYVLKPRFRHAGGDESRFLLLEGKQRGESRVEPVTMQDLDVLEKAMKLHKPGLVVIDPVQAYLGPDVDMNKAEETRPVLAALSDLVREQRACCVIIRHETKDKSRRAIGRGLGSTDITGACRVVLGAGKTPEEEHLLYLVKTNLGRRPANWGYRIDEGPVLVFEETTLTEDDLQPRVGRPSRKDEAQEFVETFLRYGPRKSEEMNTTAAKRGIPEATLKLARKAVGVISRNINGTFWAWLPGQTPPAGA